MILRCQTLLPTYAKRQPQAVLQHLEIASSHFIKFTTVLFRSFSDLQIPATSQPKHLFFCHKSGIKISLSNSHNPRFSYTFPEKQLLAVADHEDFYLFFYKFSNPCISLFFLGFIRVSNI